MKTTTATLCAAVAIALPWIGSAQAQNPCPQCGSQVQVKDIDKVLGGAALEMGVVRSTANQVGQVNILEYVAHGTMVDLEAPTLGQPVEVSRYTFNVALQ